MLKEKSLPKAHTEILIIGGGIDGTSTAYYLSQLGHEVMVLERGEIASEASGLNAGTIWPTGWGTTPDLSSTLAMGGLDIFKLMQFDLGYDIEFRESGTLKAIQTEEEYDFVREEVENLKAEGHSVEILAIRDAQSIEPALSSMLLGCMYYPCGSNANPVKTTRAFAKAAEQHGAHILINHNVTAIDHLDDEGYNVVTAQGTFYTETLVIAAGPWCRAIGSMLGLLLPVIPVRGQMWSTGPVPTQLFHSIGAAESALHWRKASYSSEDIPLELTHREGVRSTRHLYGRQTHNGEIIFGGDREVNVPREPDPSGIEVNRCHAIEIFPFLRELPIKRTWSGWMPFTRYLEPMIGNIAPFENLFVITGESSAGFEKGPMSVKLLADYIHNREMPPILSSADPARQVTVISP